MLVRVRVWALLAVLVDIVIFNTLFDMNEHALTLLLPKALSAYSLQLVRLRVWPRLIHSPYGPGNNRYKLLPTAKVPLSILNLIVIVCGVLI